MTETILITLLVVALFYIFFIRPARSEQRQRQHHLNELRIGDQVLTRGGLIAEVSGVEPPDDGPMVIFLTLADGVEVRARTTAIEEVIAPAEPDEDELHEEVAPAQMDEDELDEAPSGQGRRED